MFAFLLTVPFTQRWSSVSAFDRDVYFVTLLCAAAASAFLIAPSAYHRLTWRGHDKAHMLVASNRLAIVGLLFLALSITGAALLIGDVLYGHVTAYAVAAGTAALLAWLWFGLGLARRLRRREQFARDVRNR
jgi:hypothetical protein